LFIEIIMFEISSIDFFYSFLGLQLELTLIRGFRAMKHIKLVFVLMTAASTVLGQAERDATTSRATGKKVGIQPSEYQDRRAVLARAMGPDAVFLAFSAESARRSGDTDWPFRQEDNLLYLTSLNNPETTLALLPGEREHTEILFASDPDPLWERWIGRMPTREELTASTGIREVMSSRRADEFVDALFQGSPFNLRGINIYNSPPFAPSFLKAFRAGKAEVWLLLQDRGTRTVPTHEQQFAELLRRRYPEVRIRDASPVLLGMREIKSEAELALIRRAVDITIEAQKAAMRRVLTAFYEYEVQATIEYTFRNLGATGWAFPSIVASGRNATSLHYDANNDSIGRGGLLLTDIGAEVEGYSGDVTRTYPASGTFSSEQRAIYEVVYAMLSEMLPLMRPGHGFIEVNDKAQEVAGRELLKLGLITKNTSEQSGLYVFHSMGHPLGLQTHDVYDRQRLFEPNMVFTNEPGVYVRKADVLASEVFKKLPATGQDSIRAALDRYDGIGVRIEDDVLITRGEPEVLSLGVPRSVYDIEAWMGMQEKGK
jgi:Xaa-Pro aminopeptidase